MNRHGEIISWGIRKAGVLLLAGLLTGLLAISAALATDAQGGGNTMLGENPPVDNAQIFEPYEAFGLTYQADTNTLLYNGALVRYFEDLYPVSESGSAGVEHYTPSGTVDVYAIRDLENIQKNPDGSYDPSGILLGLAMRSEAEFQQRQISQPRPPVAAESATAMERVSQPANATVDSARQIGGPAVEAGTPREEGVDASPSWREGQPQSATTVEGGDPEEWAALYEKYIPFGLRYDSATGDLYYQGQLVRYFEDSLKIGPNTYAHYLQSSNGEGTLDLHTTFDEEGEIQGIVPYSQAEYDLRTLELFSD